MPCGVFSRLPQFLSGLRVLYVGGALECPEGTSKERTCQLVLEYEKKAEQSSEYWQNISARNQMGRNCR